MFKVGGVEMTCVTWVSGWFKVASKIRDLSDLGISQLGVYYKSISTSQTTTYTQLGKLLKSEDQKHTYQSIESGLNRDLTPPKSGQVNIEKSMNTGAIAQVTGKCSETRQKGTL